jgi:hypothetical protein
MALSLGSQTRAHVKIPSSLHVEVLFDEMEDTTS